MAKYVISTLTDVSARLSEQQQQIETLLEAATANAVDVLDKSAKFEENHLRRLKEIEEAVGEQSDGRQKTTLSIHSDLENIQAQVGRYLLYI